MLLDCRFGNDAPSKGRDRGYTPGVLHKSAETIEEKGDELRGTAKERAMSVQADEIVGQELQLPSPLARPLGVSPSQTAFGVKGSRYRFLCNC
jgi:hypothetical protein